MIRGCEKREPRCAAGHPGDAGNADEFVGADIAGKTGWLRSAALVRWRAGRTVGGINRRTAHQQSVRARQPAVICQRTQLGVGLASELRLWPPSTTLPKQLLPDRLLATIELFSVTVPFVV